MAYGKSVNLFLVNGSAEGLVIATLSNWNATALRMPRIDVADCRREELQRAGVYFLLCGGSDGEERGVYIGESDNVKTRLTQHIQKFNAGKRHISGTRSFVSPGPRSIKPSCGILSTAPCGWRKRRKSTKC